MIDYLSLAIGHGLLALALVMLLMRDDLDDDPASKALEDAINTDRQRAGKARRESQQRARDQIREDSAPTLTPDPAHAPRPTGKERR